VLGIIFRPDLDLKMLISYWFLWYFVALDLPRWAPEGGPGVVSFLVKLLMDLTPKTGSRTDPKTEPGMIKNWIPKLDPVKFLGQFWVSKRNPDPRLC
jgi:hypothetical protein